MYGPVLGASVTATSVLSLPNTGSNGTVHAILTATLVFGVILMVISLARALAIRLFNT